MIRHSAVTHARIVELESRLAEQDNRGDGVAFYELLHALDRVTSAAMWLVVHETYARNIYLDGRPLVADDFKPRPEGHTGGSLSMVPGYAGYLGIDALTGTTRAWLMGQGHCVAAVDSLNLLVGNMLPAHAARYSLSDEGLTRYVRDFYSYRVGDDGKQESPLGSHVNAHTAGGLAEGGYLGFAELQYVHMPLSGERLVAFLSDGAFEEQRGSDWAPRWWRAEDCGLVAPVMIKNAGASINGRPCRSRGALLGLPNIFASTPSIRSCSTGATRRLLSGRFLKMERRLETAAEEIREGRMKYPVPLPYGAALAPKGYGFPGAGTNLAHNLPLMANPHTDEDARERFNRGAKGLWVEPGELTAAVEKLQRHDRSGRPREKDHALVHRDVSLRDVPPPPFLPTDDASAPPINASPMAAVDQMFTALVRANPQLRPRVGNPDEMRSNRLIETLDLLKFRVTDPEPSVPESLHGAVITALNEEAVASAALVNKGGINLIHTYEAFGTKMQARSVRKSFSPTIAMKTAARSAGCRCP